MWGHMAPQLKAGSAIGREQMESWEKDCFLHLLYIWSPRDKDRERILRTHGGYVPMCEDDEWLLRDDQALI
jgi:hypothetical protein